MGVEPVLEDAGGGEGVDAGAFLIACEMAGEFSFGVVGGEIFAGAVEGDFGADGLLECEDEAFGDLLCWETLPSALRGTPMMMVAMASRRTSCSMAAASCGSGRPSNISKGRAMRDSVSPMAIPVRRVP